MANNAESTVYDLSKMSRRDKYELASQIISDISDEWTDAEDAEQWQQDNVVEYEARMSFDELAAAVRGVNFRGEKTTSSAHTPPPWKASQFSVFASDEITQICDCDTDYQKDNGRQFSDEERDANIRLIAAAPELLSALVDLLPVVQATFDNRHEIQAAQDAIDKAKEFDLR